VLVWWCWCYTVLLPLVPFLQMFPALLLLQLPAGCLPGFMTHNGGLEKAEALKHIDQFNKVCNHQAGGPSRCTQAFLMS
jgi:hypothetical protein